MTNLIPPDALNQHVATPRKRLPIPAPKTCLHCGTGFQPTPKYPQQRFCSRRCGFLAVNPPDHNARVSRATSEKRGASQRFGGDGRSYIKLRGRHLHRAVAELILGRPLRAGEVVHHRDGNRRNNDPANIEVLPSQAEHARLHGLAASRGDKK